MPSRTSIRTSRLRFGAGLTAALLICAAGGHAFGAQLGDTAQAVMPAGTRQVISIDYHRLASDPVARQLEAQVLPPQMKGLDQLLVQGGVDPNSDLNRLSFATYSGDKGIGIIGVAEGNFGGLKLSKFYTKTAKTPNPPQYSGVDIYTSGGLTFFVPDSSTLVFGSKQAVDQAIRTEQGAAKIDQNEQLSDLIAGTQSSDVWSVLDAAGARTMVDSMIGSGTGPISPSMIDKHFDGARYTIAFSNQVQVNLELMTSDALSAAALSTGLNAAIAVRARQEKDANAKSILNQIQVDSAGNHAFLQASAPESSLTSLMHTDIMQTVLR